MADLSAFENRLRKNLKHWGKWARRNGIQCYRLYDRDVPEFPLIVDIYGERVHLQEVDTGWQMDEADYQSWLDAVRQRVADVLALPLDAVALKQRRRQKGLEQYEKTGREGVDFVVGEGRHRFIVNLDEYLDTGLFLDHRNTRRMVEQEAAGKRVLNLFAYTGSFSVYAAAGGASEVITVDLSNTYQDWARRNLLENGFDGPRYEMVRADVFRYLDDAVERSERFDLIVMDPPTFSNSAKMQGILDVQRDHPLLVRQCLRLLNPGGVLYFSNNLRTFKLDESLVDECELQEISAQTVPDDFRNKRIHRCWRMVKRAL
ncbi:class I SAM-dependent methyltransferase [Chitinivorax sp. PXF-14]|uniref:class I SAM-dependent methyltransferase n=1 Tax=Chitinivorax sp. PXF-14 TaxID=3230488 RepID=UPI003466D705